MTRQIGSPFGNKLGQLTPGLKMTQVSKQSTFFPAMVQLTATKQFTFEALTMKEMWSKGHFIFRSWNIRRLRGKLLRRSWWWWWSASAIKSIQLTLASWLQCDQIGLFSKVLATSFLTKVAQNIWWIWKISRLSKTWRDYFLGNFLFQHRFRLVWREHNCSGRLQ